jgi:hypothetical protein
MVCANHCEKNARAKAIVETTIIVMQVANVYQTIVTIIMTVAKANAAAVARCVYDAKK